MAQCFFCERVPHKIFSRSHSNRATIRRQRLNAAKKTINGKRVSICTSCLKTRIKEK